MIRQPSWTYDDGYAFNAYGRPALDAADAGGPARRADHGARHAHLRRALALPAPVERRLLSRRQRGRRPRPDAVLPPDDRVAGGGRLRRRARSTQEPATPRSRCGARAICRSRSSWRSSSPAARSSAAPGTASAGGRASPSTTPSRSSGSTSTPIASIVLDVSWLNNGRVVAADRRAPAAMTSRWLLAVQQVLAWLAF